jgi:hypothetical protein
VLSKKFGYRLAVRKVRGQAAAHRFEQRVAGGQRHRQLGPGSLRHAPHFLAERKARLAAGFDHHDRGDRHGHEGDRQDQPQADFPGERAVVARAAQLLRSGADRRNPHSNHFDDDRASQGFQEQRRKKSGEPAERVIEERDRIPARGAQFASEAKQDQKQARRDRGSPRPAQEGKESAGVILAGKLGDRPPGQRVFQDRGGLVRIQNRAHRSNDQPGRQRREFPEQHARQKENRDAQKPGRRLHGRQRNPGDGRGSRRRKPQHGESSGRNGQQETNQGDQGLRNAELLAAREGAGECARQEQRENDRPNELRREHGQARSGGEPDLKQHRGAFGQGDASCPIILQDRASDPRHLSRPGKDSTLLWIV